MKRHRLPLLATLLALAGVVAIAQRRDFSVRTARDQQQEGPPTPEWTNAPSFERDVFTFVRVRYSSWGRTRADFGGWATDAPDSDLNLSYRLQQLTALKVDPAGRQIELTDPALHDFPWIYVVEPGRLLFSDEEAAALGKYLRNGGFMMVDDFWGEGEWGNFHEQMKRVFPDREPEDLEMSHPIFHCVFPITLSKNEMQVPNVGTGTWHQRTGVSWEYARGTGEACRDVHFRAYFDDKRRMMVFVAHNTDNGDGWEWEGLNHYYFREFAEKKAYPLGINVVFYAMTH